MAKTVKGARFVLKRSDTPGDSPTVPPNNDHTTGWIDTDIYKGELYLNIYDSKMWFRNDDDDMIQLVELTSGGTIDPNYLPGNYLGAMVYQGTWDASSGNPPSTTPEKGDYYIVSVSGNTDLDGTTDWQIGDFVIYNGTIWDKIDNTEPTIYASAVLYTHSTYTGLTTSEDALNFLLDEYVDYDGSTNIDISAGTGNQQIISLVNSPNISGTYIGNAIDINTNGNIGGDLYISGKTYLYDSLISTSSIIANTLQTTNTLYFNTVSNRIETDGLGIRFYQGGLLRLDFDNTGIATSHSKLRYDSSKTLDNNLDLVNKEYLDNYVALHNVGLWSSGGTTLNDPYKIIAWDGINTHYVGINVQNPTYNLHVDGSTYLNGTLAVNGNTSFDVTSYGLYVGGDTFMDITSSQILIGDMDNAYNGNYLEMDISTGQAHLMYHGALPGNPVVFDVSDTGDITATGGLTLGGNADINANIDVSGAVNLGSGASSEVVLRGTVATIANYGDANDFNLKFASASAFGPQKMGMEETSSSTRSLTIVGQDSTGLGDDAGDLIIRAGDAGADGGDGGDLTLSGGNAIGGSYSIVDGGNLNLAGGSSGNGDDGIINSLTYHKFTEGAYTERGEITTSGNHIIINDAIPGDIYSIYAVETEYGDPRSPLYISAIVYVYLDTNIIGGVAAIHPDILSNDTYTISSTNQTASNIDIRINNTTGTKVIWTSLKLN